MPLQRLQTCSSCWIHCLAHQPPPPFQPLRNPPLQNLPQKVSQHITIPHQPSVHLPRHFQRLPPHVARRQPRRALQQLHTPVLRERSSHPPEILQHPIPLLHLRSLHIP